MLYNKYRDEFEGKLARSLSQYRFRKTDGSYTYFTHRGEFVRDSHGTAIRAIVALTDVTRQRNAEEAYRTLVDNSLQGLVILQYERAVFVNQTLADMLGYSVDEMLAMSQEEVNACVHPDDRKEIWRRHRERLAGFRTTEPAWRGNERTDHEEDSRIHDAPTHVDRLGRDCGMRGLRLCDSRRPDGLFMPSGAL